MMVVDVLNTTSRMSRLLKLFQRQRSFLGFAQKVFNNLIISANKMSQDTR